eukprot:g29019.t1
MWYYWLLLPTLLVPEGYLKARSYQKPMVDRLLDLEFRSQTLRSRWTIACGVLATCVFVWLLRKTESRCGLLGTIFLIAGGVGNMADRLYVGGVIDYLLLQTHGPLVNTSFFWNLSDLYIDFAVIFLFIAIFLGELPGDEKKEHYCVAIQLRPPYEGGGGTRQIHKITSEWDSRKGVEDLTPNDMMIKFTERSIEVCKR